MNTSDIINLRLTNQQLVDTKLNSPQEVVSHLLAMQAQEFAHAKWAIALRLPEGITDSAIEKVYNDGGILRTHVMRPTWHFVCPEDIRWLLKLTGPRVNTLNSFMYRKSGLEHSTFNRCNDIMVKLLEGGRSLSRNELNEAFTTAGIIADGHRLSYIMMNAELEGLICSGPMQGKQFTYTLLEERVAKAKELSREEALFQLCSRYFSSRGPATIKDLVWWSGLTVKEVKEGIAMLPQEFIKEEFNGQEYIFHSDSVKAGLSNQRNFIMPDYDEYGISYKDRSALSSQNNSGAEKQQAISYHFFVLDGRIEGTWQRKIKGKELLIETVPFYELDAAKKQELAAVVKGYSSFIKP